MFHHGPVSIIIIIKAGRHSKSYIYLNHSSICHPQQLLIMRTFIIISTTIILQPILLLGCLAFRIVWAPRWDLYEHNILKTIIMACECF